MEHQSKIFFLCTLLAIAGCAPISNTDPPTGSFVGTAIGAGFGAGTAAVLNAPKPVIGVAGVADAGLGY
jgi:hypothetical protein